MRLRHHHVQRDGFLVGVLRLRLPRAALTQASSVRRTGWPRRARSRSRIRRTASAFTRSDRLARWSSARSHSSSACSKRPADSATRACCHARGREVVRRRCVTLCDGEARGCFVVRVHARGAIGCEHRVPERFVVVARPRGNAAQCRRRRWACAARAHARCGDAWSARARSGMVRRRRVGEHGVREVELAPIVPLGAHERRRRSRLRRARRRPPRVRPPPPRRADRRRTGRRAAPRTR